MANPQTQITKPLPPKTGEPKLTKVIPVTNNREAMHQIQLPMKSGNPGEIITLHPSLNYVPSDKWEEAKKNPHVQTLMSEKIPEHKDPQYQAERAGKVYLEDGPLVVYENTPLEGMKESDAIGAASQIYDVVALRKYEAAEGRPNVKNALGKQIATILQPDKKK